MKIRSLLLFIGLATALVSGGVITIAARADEPAAESKKVAKKKPATTQPHFWGKRRGETDSAYQKRREGMLKRCKKDALGMFAVKNSVFLTRTDISESFTVDLALYVEELHRAYQAAFSKLGAPPSRAKDLIELVCYKDQATYIKDGGNENAGGHFDPVANRRKEWNRPKDWPSGQFRLAMFTKGVTEFDEWDKSVMKHEAAHMELQLRLGYLTLDAPRWWNEGMAACFEYWDFDKTVDENFALITKRGRYAPFVRRLWGTKRWKDFKYIWSIDGAAWHHDMASVQGYLNYCQAWSLAAYMFNQGVDGKKFFNKIFSLSISLGEDRANIIGVKKRGWEEAFPLEDRMALEKSWVEWIKTAFPRNERNPDEGEFLLKMGFDPDADTLRPAKGATSEPGEEKKPPKPVKVVPKKSKP